MQRGSGGEGGSLVRARCELVVDSLLASTQLGELVRAIPRSADPSGRPVGFLSRYGTLFPEVSDRVGEPLDLPFKPRDQVRRVASVEVIAPEPDLDMRVGKGDAKLVLNSRDRLGVHREPAEHADLDLGSPGVWRGLGEARPEKLLKVLTSLGSLLVALTIDGHREPVTTGISHSANH